MTGIGQAARGHAITTQVFKAAIATGTPTAAAASPEVGLCHIRARSPGTCRCRHTAHRYRPQDTLGLRGMYHPRWDHSRRRRRLRGKKVVYRDNPCPRCIRYMPLSPNMSPRSGTPHHFGNHDISPHRCRMVVVANRTRARQASRRDRSHRYRAVCSRHNLPSQHTVAEAQGQSPGFCTLGCIIDYTIAVIIAPITHLRMHESNPIRRIVLAITSDVTPVDNATVFNRGPTAR